MDPTVTLQKGHQNSDFHFVFMLNWQNNDNKKNTFYPFIQIDGHKTFIGNKNFMMYDDIWK